MLSQNLIVMDARIQLCLIMILYVSKIILCVTGLDAPIQTHIITIQKQREMTEAVNTKLYECSIKASGQLYVKLKEFSLVE